MECCSGRTAAAACAKYRWNRNGRGWSAGGTGLPSQTSQNRTGMKFHLGAIGEAGGRPLFYLDQGIFLQMRFLNFKTDKGLENDEVLSTSLVLTFPYWEMTNQKRFKMPEICKHFKICCKKNASLLHRLCPYYRVAFV
jgi:hypothetical protein